MRAAPAAAIIAPRGLSGSQSRRQHGATAVRRCSTRCASSSGAVQNNLTVGTSTDCTEIYAGEARLRSSCASSYLCKRRRNCAAAGQIGFYCHMRTDVGVQYPASLALITGVRP
jgi:hypothetical protein